jgi:hypothetical protein
MDERNIFFFVEDLDAFEYRTKHKSYSCTSSSVDMHPVLFFIGGKKRIKSAGKYRNGISFGVKSCNDILEYGF